MRTSCKSLGKRGNGKSGAFIQFVTFINDKLHLSVRLQPFYGNRFNILFYDASAAYYYRDFVKELLGEVHGTPNELLHAILVDVQVTEYVAGSKAHQFGS